jgi:hypothetical protein
MSSKPLKSSVSALKRGRVFTVAGGPSPPLEGTNKNKTDAAGRILLIRGRRFMV